MVDPAVQVSAIVLSVAVTGSASRCGRAAGSIVAVVRLGKRTAAAIGDPAPGPAPWLREVLGHTRMLRLQPSGSRTGSSWGFGVLFLSLVTASGHAVRPRSCCRCWAARAYEWTVEAIRLGLVAILR